VRLDRELLLVLYTQRTVRDATRRFYVVKKDIKKIAREWHRGTSISRIAREINFPRTARTNAHARDRLPRKQFWKYVRTRRMHDKRLKKELKQMADDDMIYSPRVAGSGGQRRLGEKKLQDWLDHRQLKYKTEPELRATHKKTPDCLSRSQSR